MNRTPRKRSRGPALAESVPVAEALAGAEGAGPAAVPEVGGDAIARQALLDVVADDAAENAADGATDRPGDTTGNTVPDTDGASQPIGSDRLAGRAARGAAATLAGQGGRMVLQLASVVVLARLLDPSDYGLIAMVLVIVGVGEIFRDFGLTNAVVRAPTLSRAQQNGLFWVSTGIGLVLSALVFACAPLVADLFGHPQLLRMTEVLSLTFTINGLAAQFRAHLARDLRFGGLAIADFSGQAIGLVVAIVAAVLGAGRWALVAQQLSQLGSVLLIVVAFAGWLPRLPRRHAGVGEFLRVGSHLAATQIIWYLGNNIDTVTIGLRFPSASLGLYNRGFSLLMAPLNQLRTPATTVAVPVLSRLNTDYRRAGEYLKRGQLAFGYSIVPVLAVVVGAAGPISAILLGPRWTGVGPILAFLAVAAGCQTLAYIGFWVYVSRGLTTHLMRYTLLTVVLQGVCIVGGSARGVTGVAAGYALAAVLEWPLSLVWLARLTPIPVRELLLGAGRILACAIPAALAAAAASRALHDEPAVVAVAAALVAAGLVYALAALLFRRVRSDVAAVGDFARRVRRG